jgi:hypothetical protein
MGRKRCEVSIGIPQYEVFCCQDVLVQPVDLAAVRTLCTNRDGSPVVAVQRAMRQMLSALLVVNCRGSPLIMRAWGTRFGLAVLLQVLPTAALANAVRPWCGALITPPLQWHCGRATCQLSEVLTRPLAALRQPLN